MKRCPQCQSVYEENISYCLNDGTGLIDDDNEYKTVIENEPEVETIIRKEPIIIDFEQPQKPSEAPTVVLPNADRIIEPTPIIQEAPQVVIVEKPVSKKGMYFAILLIGLLLGGFSVLAILYFGQRTPTTTTNVNLSPKPTEKTKSTPTPKPSPSIETVTADEIHKTKTSADDSEFNGRVITANAYLRQSPDSNSKKIDILPIDDRLKIQERENENSPWYRVTCEHGVNGWMHGNTIEYTNQE